jgi:hypothetical protein
MPLYSPALGLPRGLTLPEGVFPLEATLHAQREAKKDGVTVPRALSTTRSVVFEVETGPDGAPRKLGYRFPSTDRPGYDVCAVVAVDGWCWRLVTVWVNAQGDDHQSLNRGRYNRP